jgi:redox-sensitive bicupin YhaK (pirin superfamily)
MNQGNTNVQARPTRRIAVKSSGLVRGPIARLVSPSDLGERMKPFVFLDYFQASPDHFPHFGYHPHSGIATVTYTLSGDTFYEETSGQTGVLRAGDVEYMSAGGGVWHRGGPTGSQDVRGFQLWIALPEGQENGPPRSQYLVKNAIATVGPARVLLGRYGAAVSPIESTPNVNYLAVDLKAEKYWTYTPPEGHDVAWVAVHEGKLWANDEAIGKGEIAVFEESGEPLIFEAESATGFVLGSAVKHPHQLFLGHYSVHTNADALRKGEANIALLGEELKANGRQGFDGPQP